jgi:hypothetical protein
VVVLESEGKDLELFEPIYKNRTSVVEIIDLPHEDTIKALLHSQRENDRLHRELAATKQRLACGAELKLKWTEEMLEFQCIPRSMNDTLLRRLLLSMFSREAALF